MGRAGRRSPARRTMRNSTAAGLRADLQLQRTGSAASSRQCTLAGSSAGPTRIELRCGTFWGASSSKGLIPPISLSLSTVVGGWREPHRRAEALVIHGRHCLPRGASASEERWEPMRTRRSPPATADFSFQLSLGSCRVTDASVPILQ
jgi:hypothetical protein